MFLLPSLFVGILLALVLGGRPARLLEREYRLGAVVPLALGLQVVLFTRLGAGLGDDLRNGLHLTTYALLLAFGAANLRVRPFALIVFGTALNAAVIAANGGQMPVLAGAAARRGHRGRQRL